MISVFRYVLRNNDNFMMLKTRNSVSIYLNIKFLQSFVSCIFLLVSNYYEMLSSFCMHFDTSLSKLVSPSSSSIYDCLMTGGIQ